jgi:hypothetical protein
LTLAALKKRNYIFSQNQGKKQATLKSRFRYNLGHTAGASGGEADGKPAVWWQAPPDLRPTKKGISVC